MGRLDIFQFTNGTKIAVLFCVLNWTHTNPSFMALLVTNFAISSTQRRSMLTIPPVTPSVFLKRRRSVSTANTAPAVWSWRHEIE